MKKSHGEGTIYKKADGKYRAQVSVDGKRLSHTGSQRECETWLRRMRLQVEKGLTYGAAKMSVGELAEEWLRIKKTKLRLATQEQYERMVRLYIVPGLGRLALKDLNAAIVQEFYRKIQQKGAGARTVQLVHTVLHGILEHGQRLGLVTVNYTELTEIPRPEKHEMKVWDESQVSLFLARADDATFYRLAFSTGMRRGEIVGLKWIDLDWRSGTLTVRRQVYEPQGGGWRFQEPKSRAGVRSIRLGPGMIEALRVQYNQTIPLMRQVAGESWQENDLIFPSANGKPRNGYEVSKRFHRQAAEAGLPEIRFHDIRHTAASIMLMHNEAPVRVAMILGQGLAVLLSTYAHFIPDDSSRAALLMDEITSPVMIAPELHPTAPVERENAIKIDDI
jgi:integrase